MMIDVVPTGLFSCDLRLERIKPPQFAREDRDGVSYLSASGYELAYATVFEFQNDLRLPVNGRLFGELNRQIVIRDADGRPKQLSGWIQGSVELADQDKEPIFNGTYCDVGLVVELTGDEDLSPKSLRLTHWESAFGTARFLGHALSLNAILTRESGALVGRANGWIL